MVRHPVALSLAAFLLAACEPPVAPPEPVEGLPPTALVEMANLLKEDRLAPRHEADGAGRAWLGESSSTEIAVSESGRWNFEFEVGPLGIAEGGALFLQVPPFWGWSTPQTRDPEAPGFTTVETRAEGVALRAFTADQGLLAILVEGGPLEAGERIEIVYGAGSAGAVADRYAERSSPFWFAVDGDGDGIRALVPDPPRIDVRAGFAAAIVPTLPSTAAPGDPIELNLALVDALGSACEQFTGDLQLELPPGWEGPTIVSFEANHRGSRRVVLRAPEAGVFRMRVFGGGGLDGLSNPLLVRHDLPAIAWGDLHGHSGFSDGTGSPEDYFRYARDVAALQVVAVTDHDHWGFPHLDQTPAMWEEIRCQVEAFHEPDRFVTLLGYEWTSWLYGHRHVLYFADDGPVFSSLDAAFETPAQLWDALRGRPALTFAHHSAGGPIATDWRFLPDPELEPVTEIVSVHGSSEARDSPGPIYRPIEGNFVRDVLARGVRLGFLGSGDSHDGHPGLSHLASSSGGLAAFVGARRTRDGILQALRERSVYATNGPRIVLFATWEGLPAGSVLPPEEGRLRLVVVAERPILSVDLIRRTGVVRSIPGEGPELHSELPVAPLAAGDFLYVRVVQDDGGAAWSSPFFPETSE